MTGSAGRVAALVEKGVEVRYVEDDADERGLAPADLLAGVVPVRSAELARLLQAYDQVWCW